MADASHGIAICARMDAEVQAELSMVCQQNEQRNAAAVVTREPRFLRRNREL